MGDTPQSNYQTNQNYDPDVRKMFKHFVTGGTTANDNENGQNVGIDDLRGQIGASVSQTNTADLLKSLNISPDATTAAPTPTVSITTQSVQESRCHAFYRILGLPVVANDKRFYNPGLDTIKNSSRQIPLSTKISIAGGVSSDFEKISRAREVWAANTAKVFSVPESVEAGVLCLTSGTYGSKGNVNVRNFASPFLKSQDPFDYKVENQAYQIPSLTSLVGQKEILLAVYQGANANANDPNEPNISITNPSVFFQHRHIIAPFMVDPRIDFSIWATESKTAPGISKRIAVPFVPDASYLKTSDTAKAERPLLEKIITDRITNNTVEDVGTATLDLINYVKNNKALQSVNIGKTPISNIFNSNGIYQTSQQQAFAQYLSSIQSLIFKLVDSMRIVHAAQGDYYWLPQPSAAGPDGGFSIRDVPLNQYISTDLITKNDFDIITNQAQVVLSNINPTVTQTGAPADPGSYAFSNYKLTFDAQTSDSQGDLSSRTKSNLAKQRNSLLSKAGDAMQVIEMILGEFSGLGLIDIIAIIGSLYVMPVEDVIGFLDADSWTRAQSVLGSSLPKGSDITTSLQSLTNTVNAFYQITENIFQDYKTNNALNL